MTTLTDDAASPADGPVPSTEAPTEEDRTAGPTAASGVGGEGRSRPPRTRRVPSIARAMVIAAVLGVVVTAGGYAATRPPAGATPLGPGVVTVEVGINRSRFDLGSLRVQEGTIVRFVVHNRDPIDHELVVGNAEVHRRHRAGSEERHPPVPGEVSIAPGSTALTFYQFDTSGTVTYACHLPGHEAYGMRGTIEVISNQRR